MMSPETGVVLAFLAIVASFAFGGGFFAGLSAFKDQPLEPPKEPDRQKGRGEYAREVGLASFRKMFAMGFAAWVAAAAGSVALLFVVTFVAGGLLLVGLVDQGAFPLMEVWIALMGILHLVAQGVAAKFAIAAALREVDVIDRSGRWASRRALAANSGPPLLTQEEKGARKLRWVALLPGALAGATALDGLLQFLFFRSPHAAMILGAIGFNAGLVVLGVAIAPSRKRTVCLAMTVLSAGLAIAFAFGWLVVVPETAVWSDHLDWVVRVGSALGAFLYLSHTIPKEPAGLPISYAAGHGQ